jgi:L-ascorbate metabolism protein UlaG (beta-lactamase superfamily)
VSVLGPTGRGVTADIITYSRPDPHPPARRADNGESAAVSAQIAQSPASLEAAFRLTGPGEYEVHGVLVTGVRTARDEQKGAERGLNTAFVFQLDGLHAVHLGDLGHLLTEEQLKEIGPVEVVCIPLGGHLAASRAAEVVAQLGANIVVPMPFAETDEANQAALDKFLHEMGTTPQTPQAKLTVTISSVPEELTLVQLEQRARG